MCNAVKTGLDAAFREAGDTWAGGGDAFGRVPLMTLLLPHPHEDAAARERMAALSPPEPIRLFRQPFCARHPFGSPRPLSPAPRDRQVATPCGIGTRSRAAAKAQRAEHALLFTLPAPANADTLWD